MKPRSLCHRLLYLAVVLALVLPAVPAAAQPSSEEATIVIDGEREAAWGEPIAGDLAGDISEPNLDLTGLYVAEDEANYYIGLDATASNWGMAYGIYIDTDLVDGSGATSDPWGRSVDAVSAHLPEYALYVWHVEDSLGAAELDRWDGSGWSWPKLELDEGGEQAYGPENDWIEYQVPKEALGNPEHIALEAFTTGGNGHAQDSVPSDTNVTFPNPVFDDGLTTTLSAFVVFPPLPPAPTWYLRGSFNGWGTDDPMYDDGNHGDAAAGDGVFGASVTVATAGRYEFKAGKADWSTAYPGSDNSWFYTTADGQVVTATLDTNSHADGWLPAANIVGVSTEPGTWTAVGDWQGWNNASPSTPMAALGDGTYQLEMAIPAPGNYQYKAVRTGTWDAVGADGRSVNANTLTFTTVEADQNVTFTVDALAGRARVEVAPLPPRPRLDDNVWWDGLGHNSRDDLYRSPGGAVTTGVPVTLRLRTFHNDVTDVTLRVWSTTAGAQTLYPMARVASTADAPYGYDYWEATIPAQAQPTILYYRFIVRDGADEDYYEDDDLFDGGWGMVYEESPDYSFQIDVYEPSFTTPDWMQNAVVYQIFPDRFFDGDTGNDPKVTDPTVYGEDVLVKAWGDEPEGYCRAYAGETCDEQPLGRDFFGGDLEGIRQKLGYLKGLGVTAVYLNPIFQAPSNHLYDTTDYSRIDPYFGSNETFIKFVQQADKLGIHVILDGVFNHTSSDSIYFDRYLRYDAVGAYESQQSPYFDWYTFSVWPGTYNSWWGFDSMPVLTEVPAVRDFIYGADDSIARRWIDMGAAGWRLDVAPDKSHDFWEGFRTQVKDADPDAVIIGEIWDDASEWLLGDEFDSTMNYRFRRALLGFLNGDSSDPNQGAISGLNPDEFDSALHSIQEDYPPAAFAAAMNLVDSHDTQRILWTLTPGANNPTDKEENAANLAVGKAKLELLAILQMTLPGAPTIYYGDEVGLTGDTDPDCRRPYPWGDEDAALQDHYRKLIHLRDQYSFLRTGSYDRLYTSNDDGTYAYGRKDTTGAAVVAVNRDTQAHSLTIPVSGYIPDGTTLTDALGGGGYKVRDGAVTIDVRGDWGAVLITRGKVDLTPPEAPAELSATPADGNVHLEWQAAEGAAGYNVYRSYVSGGGYVRVNASPVTGTAYDDGDVANGTVYYCVVTAVDAAGNESGRSNEVEALPHVVIGWANLQWPPSIEHTLSALTPTGPIYGQVWIDGKTNLPGPTAGLIAQVGYGPEGSNPVGNPDWLWTDAAFNVDADNNDEFMGTLLPEEANTFDYCYRYSTTAGRDWVYADQGPTEGYSPAEAGALTVNPSTDTTAPAAPTGLWLKEAGSDHLRLAWTAPADADLFRYEVMRRNASSGDYEKVANVPAAAGAEYTDWSVSAGASYYYVVRAVDTSFNRSGDSNELRATAEARDVAVTFRVTVPAGTPGDATVYIGSNANGWTPNGTAMAKDGDQWAVTVTLSEGYALEYKYTLGNWEHVEKGASCEELNNRTATVAYGTDGTMTLEDTVVNWRNVLPCGDNGMATTP